MRAETERDPDVPDRPGHGQRCRRAYYRVETRLPLRLTWLTSEESEILRQEIQTPGPEEAEPGDLVLAAALRRIEEKLDLLLEGAGHASPRPIGEVDRQSFVLSGCGLQAETGEPFRAGDPVKVEILLPEATPLRAVALAHVVYGPERREPAGGQRVALSFSAIDERHRDAIVRHVCDAQRLSLRSVSPADRSLWVG